MIEVVPIGIGAVHADLSALVPATTNTKYTTCWFPGALGAYALLQSLVHDIRQPAAHPLDYVRVGIEGDAYAGVPEKLLDVFWMLARHEEYRGAVMPEVVQPDSREPRPLEEWLEVPTQKVRTAHGRARRSRHFLARLQRNR